MSAPTGRSRVLLAGGLLLCAAVVLGLLLLPGGRGAGQAAPAPDAVVTSGSQPQQTAGGSSPTATTALPATREQPDAAHTPISGLPTIAESDLPAEARETMRLIEDGGPFPHRQDASTFFNREGILPDRRRGYYREYTVRTPRSPDRGARRIVAGAEGDLYFTPDHYDSFQQIEEGT